MYIKYHIYTIAISILFFTACVSKTDIVLVDSGKSKNSIIVSTNKGSSRVDKVGTVIGLNDKNEIPKKIRVISKEKINTLYSDLFKALPEKPKSYILYFKQNSTKLTKESEKVFKKALKTIEERSPCIVDIIGHTDTIGSHKINKKISLERAEHIKIMILKTEIKYIKPEIQNVEAQSISLVTKGYGEEDLLVKTQNNVAEVKNRNVEIFIK